MLKSQIHCTVDPTAESSSLSLAGERRVTFNRSRMAALLYGRVVSRLEATFTPGGTSRPTPPLLYVILFRLHSVVSDLHNPCTCYTRRPKAVYERDKANSSYRIRPLLSCIQIGE